MIQPVDLAVLKFYMEDESRYKPLHSLVENYNKRNSVNKAQVTNVLNQLEPIVWEDSDTESKDEAFVAGFKEDLDKVLSKIINSFEKIVRAKRENELYKTNPVEKEDFFQMKSIDLSSLVTTKSILNGYDYKETTDDRRKYTPIQMKAITIHTNEIELNKEEYDYENFKREYEEQMEEYKTDSSLSNYTDEGRSQKYPEETLQKLLDFKNCTEISKKLGIKTIDCLIYNYEHKTPKIKKTVQKIWLIIRVWLLIYICVAILCWCQKGWCCCCFRCKFCFPNKRILLGKQYYAVNPPGILAKEVKKNGKMQQFITYKSTEFEEDAFERFESMIRNI